MFDANKVSNQIVIDNINKQMLYTRVIMNHVAISANNLNIQSRECDLNVKYLNIIIVEYKG